MFAFHDVIAHVTLFGAGLCFLMSIEQVTSRNRDNINRLSALLFFCNGIIAMGAASLAYGLPLREPRVIFLFITSIFLVGPLNFFYYDSLVNPKGLALRKLALHTIPAHLLCGIVCWDFFYGTPGYFPAAGAITTIIYIAIFIGHSRSPQFFNILKRRESGFRRGISKYTWANSSRRS